MGDERSMRDEDFGVEEVWSYHEKEEDSSPTSRIPRESSFAWRLPSKPRMIRRSSAGSHEITKVAHQQSSAPVNIPDWSKIYGKKHANYTESSSSRDRSWVGNGDYYEGCGGDGGGGGEDEDDDEDMVPPHEWLAKKLARSQISSFSVCEGMGRTLKGRDLSKVRNAVLTKTGFLE